MFDVSKIQDISILHLYGEISILEMELVQNLIESFKKHRHHKILIDLARVDHIHFEAVKRWGKEAENLRGVEGDLKLVNTNNQVKNILKFTGADQFLQDYSSMADAVLSFLRNSKSFQSDAVYLVDEGDSDSSSTFVKDKASQARLH